MKSQPGANISLFFVTNSGIAGRNLGLWMHPRTGSMTDVSAQVPPYTVDI